MFDVKIIQNCSVFRSLYWKVDGFIGSCIFVVTAILPELKIYKLMTTKDKQDRKERLSQRNAELVNPFAMPKYELTREDFRKARNG